MKYRILILLALIAPSGARAADELSSGQTVYLPVYSHIWHGDRVGEKKHPLKNLISALVSVRNTSLKTPIQITSARYYSTEGRMLKEYINQIKTIPPMGTLELFVEKKEAEGGSGANFLIQWQSAVATNPPLVEAIHADIRGHQTLAFITTGRSISPDK